MPTGEQEATWVAPSSPSCFGPGARGFGVEIPATTEQGPACPAWTLRHRLQKHNENGGGFRPLSFVCTFSWVRQKNRTSKACRDWMVGLWRLAGSKPAGGLTAWSLEAQGRGDAVAGVRSRLQAEFPFSGDIAIFLLRPLTNWMSPLI